MKGLLNGYAQAAGQEQTPVGDDEITRFVRHCNQLEAVRMSTIREEFEAPRWGLDVDDELDDPANH